MALQKIKISQLSTEDLGTGMKILATDSENNSVAVSLDDVFDAKDAANTAAEDANSAAASANNAASDANTAATAANEAVSEVSSAVAAANETLAMAQEIVESRTGPQGKSAYQLAVENGYVGTEQQWLASLKGEQGNPGSSQEYPFELENSFRGGVNKALTAEMGKGLNGRMSDVEGKVGQIANFEDAELIVADNADNVIMKVKSDGLETTHVKTTEMSPHLYNGVLFFTDMAGHIIIRVGADGLETTHIKSPNILANQWQNKVIASYGDSVTDPSETYSWGNKVAAYLNAEHIKRGIGSTTFAWRNGHGGQVAWVNSETGAYVGRNDSYNYDNYEGNVTIPDGCTPIRGDGCSWLRITSMFPASVKDTIDAVLVMFHNDYHQDMDTSVEFIENDTTDPEWAASAQYAAVGGDYNINTVQGGIASTIMKLQAWMPDAKVILMTPVSGVYATSGEVDGNFDNEQAALMYQLRGEVLSIASRMSIPCIDNYGTDGINSLNRTRYIADNIHPTTARGRDALAMSVIGGLISIIPNI